MGGLNLLSSCVRRHWLAGVLAAGLSLPGGLSAQDKLPAPAVADARAAAVAAPAYDLASLQATALARNTGIAAAKASLAAAVAGQQGVDNLHVPTFLVPDLPYRRKQACLGVTAAQAGVRNAELQAVFGVQFSFVSVLYAREQQRVAEGAVERLGVLIKGVQGALGNPEEKTDLSRNDLNTLRSLQDFAWAQLAQARTGSERALAALREAAGLPHDAALPLRATRLLDARPTLDKARLVELALANRPELVQSSINVQVTELEVAAQGSRRNITVRTFASGADLHAVPVPAGQFDQDYRPAPAGPEMPPFLSGKQSDRVARAAAYATRAAAVHERARGLIALEVGQAYLRAREAGERRDSLAKASSTARKSVEERIEKLRNSRFGEGSKAVLDDLLRITLLSSQYRVQGNEARYQLLVALATLERATGAAFCADLAAAAEVKDD